MVYVSELAPSKKCREWSFEAHAYLVADTRAELLAFAGRIGLRPEWIQNNDALPHFDLSPGKRWQAVHKGVTEMTSREIAAWRARLRYTRRNPGEKSVQPDRPACHESSIP